eukprot:COSAG02_NODE_34875_length_477_cov_0.748677_2_plen_76_part_01
MNEEHPGTTVNQPRITHPLPISLSLSLSLSLFLSLSLSLPLSLSPSLPPSHSPPCGDPGNQFNYRYLAKYQQLNMT